MLSKTTIATAILLIMAIVFGFMLTPLGFETRTPDLRTWAIVPFFVAASLGIPLAAFILLLVKKLKAVGILIIINAVVMLFLVPGDLAGFFFTSAVPQVILVFEFLSVFVSIGFLLAGPQLIRESKS